MSVHWWVHAMLRVSILNAPPPHVAHAALAAEHATTFILESRDGPERLARHSIVGWNPSALITADQSGVSVDDASGRWPRPKPNEPVVPFLRRLLRAAAPNGSAEPEPGPFVGGLVGCLGDTFIHALEPKLPAPAAEPWPRVLMGLYLDALVYDHQRGTCHYVSLDADRRADLDTLNTTPAPTVPLRVGRLHTALDDARFADRVRAVQELVHAGECFQLVLSRSWTAAYEGDLGACYAWLRDAARVPYLYMLRFGAPERRVLLGASPEMLVRVRGMAVETFPIAGTRPRTGNPRRDAQLADELRADAKEAAEHAMLVDLARNDLSRVCQPGTVDVAEFRRVEAFRHVQHLVSHVRGTLQAGKDAWDALAAVFPAGTVSGAPKLRALEHIASLEATPRGPYGGAVLYASASGDLDSAITIRSLHAQNGRLEVRAGAGIVLDSQPDAEAAETRHKAQALVEALQQFGATLDNDVGNAEAGQEVPSGSPPAR